MVRMVSSEWIAPLLFLFLSTVPSWGATEVVDISVSGRGRRVLQQNVDIAGEQEKILLEFRDLVKFQPGTKLASWVGGDGGVCLWPGVRCDVSDHVVEISLAGEQLEGDISPVLGQLQFLKLLDLSDNNFQNAIPYSLGSLQSLEILNISINTLSGAIPSSLYNCSSLRVLDLSRNSLSSSIPDSFGVLQSLIHLNFWNNTLSGNIPATLGNCSALQVLVLSYNTLEGGVPSQLGNLQSLEELYLGANVLTGLIPTSIGNSSLLRELHMGSNKLTGSIPDEIGRLTKLEALTLQSNNLEMGIPESLRNCTALTQLNLGFNRLTGSIPDFLASIKTLTVLNLESNSLSELIPKSLSELFRLETLLLNGNHFTGAIPDAIGLLPQLRKLNLGNNQLSGAMLSLEGPSLVEVRLNNNNLRGEILEFTSSSASILTLDISFNQLTGAIPDSIEKMREAQFIDLSFNNLTGSIPSSLKWLERLESLDLSDNHLSGEIPSSLGQLHRLKYVDVSNNDLHGSVPTGWERFPAVSFIGNSELCIQCPPNGNDAGGNDRNRKWIYIAVAIGTLAGGIVALSTAIWCTRKGKKSKARLAPIMEISNFSDGVVLTVQDVITATNNFSDADIIGEGSKSVVYNGVLPNGMVIAVKRLIVEHNEVAAKRLNHEMQMVGSLRHRNWLRIYGYLSSPDIKALVLEYAPNGSLHHQLHGVETCQLTWKMRLEIAMGIAEAMVHIHHELPRPIIHLDLKPSNVLLDENFVVKVTDLGISKLLYLGSASRDSTTSALFGTTGYIPPEYGISTKISTKGDVFNYGILLLELLTRKTPTFRFEGDVSLRQWVSDAAVSSDGMLTVLDRSIQNELAVHEDQIQLLLRVGLLCTETSPAKRPSMKDVRDMLMQIESLSSPQLKVTSR